MYAISRHEHGICLNPREYVLDKPDGDVMLFNRTVDAVAYLRAHWEDMPENTDELDEYGVFIEPYVEHMRCPNCGSHPENTYYNTDDTVYCRMCHHNFKEQSNDQRKQ